MLESVIRFTKMSGAGNDFVVIDNRGGLLPEPLANLARAMCPRRTAVGADGLIAVEEPRGDEDFSMRYYNSDGSEAELCGNGARCVALFAHGLGFAGASMRFSSRSGIHEATVTESGISVTMPKPEVRSGPVDLPLGRGNADAFLVVVGVPHVVIFREELDTLDLASEGRRIRNHSSLGPEGANVNFVQVVDGGRIKVRTYERGVEAETLACGTGATASAIAACRKGLVTAPVEVETAGGDVLRVHGAGGSGRLELEGPAIVVYDGVFDYRICDTQGGS
jgi:diaminopimelate epimerase